jgi:hypothetical protein
MRIEVGASSTLAELDFDESVRLGCAVSAGCRGAPEDFLPPGPGCPRAASRLAELLDEAPRACGWAPAW